MRCIATQPNSIVRYLGRIAGAGSVISGGETVARAAYDFDGFTAPRGGVMSSGELQLAPSDLKAVFGGLGVQLLTDDGRLLDLKFSEKELRPAANNDDLRDHCFVCAILQHGGLRAESHAGVWTPGICPHRIGNDN